MKFSSLTPEREEHKNHVVATKPVLFSQFHQLTAKKTDFSAQDNTVVIHRNKFLELSKITATSSEIKPLS
jgi:hypothetical protein